jgi:ABC-type lipoprotein export system ATPase subunit
MVAIKATEALMVPFSSNGHLIHLENLSWVYPTPAGPLTVLHSIDLCIASGQLVAITGKSGSGKSTLLNLLTGIDRPTSGSVVIGGAAIHAMSEDQRAAWRGQNLGIVFQFFQLVPTLTVLENVLLPMELSGYLPRKERKPRALALLEQMGIGEHAHKFPTALSGGQQQRAAIARAQANDPAILVADEPTGNLDSHTAADVFALFRALTAQGKTVVMVTHDRELAAQAERVITLTDGRIV